MSEIFIVTLPDIGEGVVEGEITAWLKEEGDTVEQDEPIVEVMTDKATVELPAPYPGILSRQHHQVGDIAHKDKPIYDITLAEGTEVHEQTHSQSKPSNTSVKTPNLPSPTVKSNHAPAPSTGQKALAAPPVRALAKSLGIDINEVPASGPDGRVVPEDIHSFLAGAQEPLPPTPEQLEGDELVPVRGVRRLVAKKMTLSKKHIPHFNYQDKADVTLLIKFRNKNKPIAEREGVRLTFMPLFIRALSLTIEEYPQINASFDEHNGTIVMHSAQNIAIAMKSSQGLIVPVLKGVESMNFHQTIRAYHELHLKAVDNALEPADMRDSTITISNFGTEGGLWASPVINFPEAAIIATAKIQKQPMAKGNDVVVRDILNCSWSFDHRLIDGDIAAAVSNTFISHLENPSHLI